MFQRQLVADQVAVVVRQAALAGRRANRVSAADRLDAQRAVAEALQVLRAQPGFGRRRRARPSPQPEPGWLQNSLTTV